MREIEMGDTMAAKFVAIILVIIAGMVLWNWGMLEGMIPTIGNITFDFNTMMLIILLIFVVMVLVLGLGKVRKGR